MTSITINVGDDDMLKSIIERLDKMALNLDALVAEVSAIHSAEESAATLLAKLHDELVAAGGNQAAIDKVVADLEAGRAQLAAAVAANTDAAPAPAPAATPEPTPAPEPAPAPAPQG